MVVGECVLPYIYLINDELVLDINSCYSISDITMNDLRYLVKKNYLFITLLDKEDLKLVGAYNIVWQSYTLNRLVIYKSNSIITISDIRSKVIDLYIGEKLVECKNTVEKFLYFCKDNIDCLEYFLDVSDLDVTYKDDSSVLLGIKIDWTDTVKSYFLVWNIEHGVTNLLDYNAKILIKVSNNTYYFTQDRETKHIIVVKCGTKLEIIDFGLFNDVEELLYMDDFKKVKITNNKELYLKDIFVGKLEF